jgi:O-antigen/teichoic acid export membrane protein
VEPAPPPQPTGRALLGPGLFVGGAVIAANGLNAVFQIVLARILEPPEYSLLVALVVVTLIAAVPPLAFQAAVAREVAVALAEGRRSEAGASVRDTVRGLLPWAFGVLALGGLAAGALAAGGRGDVGATLATSATISAALVIPAVWGGLQGARLFVVLGLAHLTFAGTRLGAGAGIGLAGGGAGAVMGGVAVATLFTLVLTLVPLRGLWREAIRSKARRLATLPNAAAATGLTLLTALASVDVLVAKLAFPSSTAGAYGVASVGARVLLLVPIGVTTVLFPRVAVLRDRVRERRHLLAGIAVVGVLGALTTAVLWLCADPLIRHVFGRKYEAAIPWLGPLSLAMALYALTTVYVYHFLSLARTRFALVLVGVFALQLAAFGALHGRPADLIGVQIAAAAVTLAAAEGWYLLRH